MEQLPKPRKTEDQAAFIKRVGSREKALAACGNVPLRDVGKKRRHK